jgi:hypothetical protein
MAEKKSNFGSAREVTLRERFQFARLEAAFTGLGTASVMGFVIIASAGVYAAGTRGYLAPGAWQWALGMGVACVAIKVMLDFIDGEGYPALWSEVLADHFGKEALADDAVGAQVRLAIEYRRRLAEAEARAGSTARELVAPTIVAVDAWIDSIARLANRIAMLRDESRFQSKLVETNRDRLAEIGRALAEATDNAHRRQLSETSTVLSKQADVAQGFVRFVEGGFLRLEHAVAGLGTATSQLIIVLTRGDDFNGSKDLNARIGDEIASVESLLLALDRVESSSPLPKVPMTEVEVHEGQKL